MKRILCLILTALFLVSCSAETPAEPIPAETAETEELPETAEPETEAPEETEPPETEPEPEEEPEPVKPADFLFPADNVHLYPCFTIPCLNI